jgi:membrane-associated protease RseP (regulator of RpoE activity)
MNAPRALLAATAVAGGLLAAAAGSREAAPLDDRAPVQAAPAAEAVVVPFVMLPSNHMVVEARINEKGPYRLIFDLGAPVTLLNNKVAEESGAIDRKAPRSFMMGARGEARLGAFQLGDLKASDVPVIVMDHPALKALSGIFSRRPLAGIVGYTFWARYKMTIDYQRREMTFTPVDFEVGDLMRDLPARMTGPKRARTVVLAPRGLWGLQLAPAGGDAAGQGVAVTAVIPGSAAQAAGLRPGDVVTAIDGRWTTSIADAHHAAQGVAPGKATAVEVRRGSEVLNLELTPAEGL